MRITKQFTALFLGMALLSPVFAAGPEEPATVTEVVAAVEQTYGGATSVRADFVQVVRNTAMGTEDRQRGRLSLERPRKMRIEMGFPVEKTFVSDGKTMWIYTAKDKQVIEMPELGDGGGMGALLEDLGNVSELFDVSLVPEKVPSKPSYTVQLIPKKPGAIKSLLLTLTKQKNVLQDLVLVDQMDGVTEMNFTMVRMNQDIPDQEFTFVAPPGVKVVKSGAL